MASLLQLLEVLWILVGPTLAIRLQHRASAQRLSQEPKDLFCMAFVARGTEEANFDLQEAAFKKCDGYAFFSTTDDPAHNMYKIMEVAPKNKNDATWEFPLHMWSKVKELELTNQYKWFVKLDTDAFVRPDKLKQTLARFSPQESVVVARQGRNSNLPIVGNVHALSGPMVDELIAVKDTLANPEQYLRDDRLLSAWVGLTQGHILNAINDQDGCTTLASTDNQDLPSEQDIQAMLNGQSYLKNDNKKPALELGSICYSPDLAVIHPIKDRATYEKLIATFSPSPLMNLKERSTGGLQIGVLGGTDAEQKGMQMHLTTGSLRKPALGDDGRWMGGAKLVQNLLTDLPADKMEALEKCGPMQHLGRNPDSKMKKKANQVWLFTSGEDPTAESLGKMMKKIPKKAKVLILGSQWNDEVREILDSNRIRNIFVPFGSLSFSEFDSHTPMELVNRTLAAAAADARDADHTIVYQQNKCVGYRQTFWDKVCQGVNKVGKECSYLNKCNGDMSLGKKDLESAGSRKDEHWMDAAVRNYARYNFAMTMEHKVNKYGYLTEKILLAYLAGAVPVYGGASQASEIFDPETFVEYHEEDGGASAVQKIQELIADPKKHHDTVLKQAVSDESMKKYFTWHASTFAKYGDGLRMRIVNELLSLCNAEE